MARFNPLLHVGAASSSYVTSKRESFTIWMKSLVIQGNGCTVFNENGGIVYRIDNYDKKGSHEVYLMDFRGKVLFTILRRVSVFGRWRCYKGDPSKLSKQKPEFQVTKDGKIAILSNNEEAISYKLEVLGGETAFNIIECREGRVVAEARRKQSPSGVVLGGDVLTLVVKPHVDHSFIMALAAVYGLMYHKL